MSSPADIAETRARMLGELAELGLVLARDLQQAALIAEDAQDKVRLADAFARVSRGVRQSLALHARMEREATRDSREAEAEAVRLEPARRARRKAAVRSAVQTLIWREHERLDVDPDTLLDDLDSCLDDEACSDGFLQTSSEALIARLCRMLDLPVAARNDVDDPAPSWSAAAGDRFTAAPDASAEPPPLRVIDVGGLSPCASGGERRSSA